MESTLRLGLAEFTLDVFFDDEISFFSAIKKVDEMRTLLLVWKKDEGFYTHLVLKDPNSDAETAKLLNLEDFPTHALVAAITVGGENVPRNLAEQLLEILTKKF